jgi:hypothetical protein
MISPMGAPGSPPVPALGAGLEDGIPADPTVRMVKTSVSTMTLVTAAA